MLADHHSNQPAGCLHPPAPWPHAQSLLLRLATGDSGLCSAKVCRQTGWCSGGVWRHRYVFSSRLPSDRVVFRWCVATQVCVQLKVAVKTGGVPVVCGDTGLRLCSAKGCRQNWWCATQVCVQLKSAVRSVVFRWCVATLVCVQLVFAIKTGGVSVCRQNGWWYCLSSKRDGVSLHSQNGRG